MLKLLLLLLPLLTQITACAWAPGLMFDEDDFEIQETAEEEPEPLPVTLIPISASLIEKQFQKSLTSSPINNIDDNAATTAVVEVKTDVDAYEYKVGPQDVLNIIVWDHPELTIPTGGQRPAEEDGHRVSSSGNIFYPYVGVVKVAGKTTQRSEGC
jgi:polysaccharide export outer membrane protein